MKSTVESYSGQLGGTMFPSELPATAKARCWDKEVHDQGTRRSSQSAEPREQEEQADIIWDYIYKI